MDLLTYGAPTAPGLDVSNPDREFTYSVDRKPGFVDGVPGMWWSINGHLFPDVPMFVVTEGDVVLMHIENHSGEVHPMHLHGHHALVLSRDGKPSTGSPWWTDSLDVGRGEKYDIAFVADNPGVWMDHCHNLPHAADGLSRTSCTRASARPTSSVERPKTPQNDALSHRNWRRAPVHPTFSCHLPHRASDPAVSSLSPITPTTTASLGGIDLP